MTELRSTVDDTLPRDASLRDEALGALVRRGGSPRQWVVACTQWTDAILASCADDWAAVPAGCAVVALGGFGRAELAPGSDIDVLIVHTAQSRAEANAFADAFVRALWDRGLKVGHAVRTLRECHELFEEDIASATSHVETRLLAGDARLCQAVRRRAVASLRAREGAFFEWLRSTRVRRRGQYGNTVYHLQPNLKFGAGGLRDVHELRWALAVVAGHPEPLVAPPDLLPRKTIEELLDAYERILGLRVALQLAAGARTNRLSYEHQEAVAVLLGYGDRTHPDVAGLMREFYRAAHTVARRSDALVSLCAARAPQARPSRPVAIRELPSGVSQDGEFLVLDAAELDRRPVAAFELFAAAARHRLPIHPGSTELVGRRAADAGPIVSVDLGAREALWTVLLEPDGGEALAAMHDAGLLATAIPQFAPIVGLFQPNFFHAYTVDIHSLHAVTALKALRASEPTRRAHPVEARLLDALPDLRPLFLATLLHDVGKGTPGGHLASQAANLASAGARTLGLDPAAASDVAFLVRHHLDMALCSQQRDLSDPATIDQFRRLVGSRERLAALTLLTYADMAAVDPEFLTEWREALLLELYARVDEALRSKRAARTPTREVLVDQLVAAAARTQGEPSPEALREFLAAMPPAYLRAVDPQTARVHAAQLACYARTGDAQVDLVGQTGTGLTRIAIVAADRPGLLAQSAALLAIEGFDIVGANISSHSDRVAVDTYEVSTAGGAPGNLEARLERIARGLGAWQRTEADWVEVLRREPPRRRAAPRAAPGVQVEVNLSTVGASDAAVIDLRCPDRPGLLALVADALYRSGLSVAWSRISTEGVEARDSFYVQDLAGRAPDETLLRLAASRLRRDLQEI